MRVHHRHRFRPAARQQVLRNAIGTQRGDWTDHWADGVGSSAFEVGVNRAAHEIVGIGESARSLAPQQGPERLERRSRCRRHLRVDDALRRAHLGRLFLGRGAAFAVQPGAVEPQGRLRLHRRDGRPRLGRQAPPTRSPRRSATKGPEGIFNLGNLDPKEAFKPSGIDELLVFNTLALGAQGHRRGARAARRRRPGRHARHLLQPPQQLGRRHAPSPRSAASPAPSRRWATPSST